ncbi:MAG: hypothetical protein V7K27_32820 [Nostoc sp.]|uniref:hypothetical protein n=1 Tax=Nostoc sp. TaxID=1180 RepID=UPI002FF81C6E
MLQSLLPFLTYSPAFTHGDSNSWFAEIRLLYQERRFFLASVPSILETIFSPCFPACEADSQCPWVLLFCHSMPNSFMPFFKMLIAALVLRHISTLQLEHE